MLCYVTRHEHMSTGLHTYADTEIDSQVDDATTGAGP